jgi:hypothetical protein
LAGQCESLSIIRRHQEGDRTLRFVPEVGTQLAPLARGYDRDVFQDGRVCRSLDPCGFPVSITSTRVLRTKSETEVASFTRTETARIPGGIRDGVAPELSLAAGRGYGLFAVMTITRPEIVIEGSNDSVTWLAYEFKYKPGDLTRRPAWVAPHQPRLDWQMWFAALGDYQSDPWIIRFMARLLQGSPEVLRLLGRNPFPDGPPHYVRAMLYRYRFTSPEERRSTGAWWGRELKGVYVPAVSLRN